MTTTEDRKDPTQASRGLREADVPQGLVERQETISRSIVRRLQRRRERFLVRSGVFSLRKELARNLYLSACVLFDGLVIPQILLLLGGPLGVAAAGGAFLAAIYAQWRGYRALFSLPSDSQGLAQNRPS